ncbi:MAG: YopX family protein [Bacteroides sp.]|nr:YopX family protein [Bacteroides sp.]
MRTIKFRGKGLTNNRWLYGSLALEGENAYISYGTVDFSEVDPATVGQFTGLYDKNDKEIYEGDIVECNGDICKVVYSAHYVGFALDKKGWAYLHFFGEAFSNEECLVIGNIYDNQKLLKGGEL